jgi:dihydroorotase
VTVDRALLRSKSKNTPFHGWTFRGGVAATIVGGRVVYTNRDAPVRLTM